jgi:hypothetical protein
METKFIPGMELCREYYWEVVRPILDEKFPDIKHAAALVGDGSEVLGLDTTLSMDHDWIPRVMLFLVESEYPSLSEALGRAVRTGLPDSFRGFSLDPKGKHGDTRGIEILTPRRFLTEYLGFDIRKEMESADWLTFPEQKLCGITKGAIYWDGIDLEAVRHRFAYYPRDIWLYLLAAGWNRIGQEEHLMGRAGGMGDEIGSAIIAARLVRDVMRLCFLMEKRYAPYAKWFGTAFGQLTVARDLSPMLKKVLLANDWPERERQLASVYEFIAVRHNNLGITEPLDAKAAKFYERPFIVIGGGRFAEAICEKISDPAMKQVIEKKLIGGIDQISDNTDILCGTQWRDILRRLYEK